MEMVGEKLVGLIEGTLDKEIEKWEELAMKNPTGLVEGIATNWRPDKEELKSLQRLVQVHQMAITLHMAKEQKQRGQSGLTIPRK